MAIVGRKRKSGTVYYVALRWRGAAVWERVGTDRREAERVERRIKREIATGAYSPRAKTGAATVASYAQAWGARRTNRTADDDRRWLRLHVVTREWFARMRLDDVRARDVKRLVEEIASSGLAPKSVANCYGVLRTMFGDAHREELTSRDPCDLPRGTLKRAPVDPREPYTRAEVVALTTGDAVDADRRMFAALAFYTAGREGEVCGLRWRMWDRESSPLGAITIATQYNDQPLKTDEPRRVPVHPALARMLDWWWREGFELAYCRAPKLSDFIVPMRANARNRHGVKPHHTRSSAYKAWVAACEQAGVSNRTLHATRHTMITWARRGGARKDVLEMITHNAKGEMIDQYTHLDWSPLCDAILCLSYRPDVDASVDARSKTSAKTVEAPGIEPGRPVANNGESASIGESKGAEDPPSFAGDRAIDASCDARQQRGAVRRLFRECVALATSGRDDAEPEVASRLRRLAKALPQPRPVAAGKAVAL